MPLPLISKKYLYIWLISGIILVLGLITVATSQFLFKKSHNIIISQRSSAAPEIIYEENNTTFSPSVTAGQSNILILGIPGQGNDAPNLTDTILLANIQYNSISLISIPRDLLIALPSQTKNTYTKINALYASSRKPNDIVNKVEEITGVTIQHYLIVDLNVIKEIIDKINGINVLVENDIYDIHYPGPNHSYQTFSIKRGWRYLDGNTALKYIRSRHSTSDFDRMERQQQIIKTVKNKLASQNLNWNIGQAATIFQSLSANLKTDLNILELWQLWQTVKKTPNEHIYKFVIDQQLLDSETINLNNEAAAVLKPKAGIENYQDIQNYIKRIINL